MAHTGVRGVEVEEVLVIVRGGKFHHIKVRVEKDLFPTNTQ
jgi:hypothetical protein